MRTKILKMNALISRSIALAFAEAMAFGALTSTKAVAEDKTVRIGLPALRDWTGLIASVATVLFLTFYPHGPSADAHRAKAYRAAAMDKWHGRDAPAVTVTAGLADENAPDRR